MVVKQVLCGGMAEWLKAAVLKTVEGNTSVGSNPTPSANKIAVQFYLKPQLTLRSQSNKYLSLLYRECFKDPGPAGSV